MKRIIIVSLLGILTLTSCDSAKVMKTVDDVLNAAGGSSKPVSQAEIASGLKEALTQGITKGTDIVSKTDGYLKNPQIKIPWPQDVKKVENTLRDLGLGNEVDRVITNLNRAAEDAALKAKPIFISAIKQITFQDIMNILKGQENAATEFLKRTTTSQLKKEFHPVIQHSLNKVNATKYWDDVITRYNKIPLVQNVNPDLTSYVTEKALDGLFLMVAKEEAKIRKDPLARVTDLLKRVFALQDKK